MGSQWTVTPVDWTIVTALPNILILIYIGKEWTTMWAQKCPYCLTTHAIISLSLPLSGTSCWQQAINVLKQFQGVCQCQLLASSEQRQISMIWFFRAPIRVNTGLLWENKHFQWEAAAKAQAFLGLLPSLTWHQHTERGACPDSTLQQKRHLFAHNR